MTSTPPHTQRSKGFKIAILILAPIMGLLLLELGFRVRAHYRNSRTLDQVREVPAEPEVGGRTRFVDIIRPNANDKIIYDLRPNLDTTFKGKKLTTNSVGFRDPERVFDAQENEITIVGIGASMMFAHGLADGEGYMPRIEIKLNNRYSGHKWRVINTSAPSYNVVMKVETLIQRGLAYKPDLVLLNIAGNNLDLPQYIRTRQDPLATNRSFLLDFFGDREGRKTLGEERMAEMAWVDRKAISWDSGAVTSPEQIPEQYRDLVGWAPFRVALDKLKALSEKHDFEVIVFAFIEHDLVPSMLEEGRQRGFHIISLMDDLDAYLIKNTGAAFDIENYKSSKLVVSPFNLHPSRLQHRMAVDRLLEDMDSMKIIERLMLR
ncbi:MAG: hypothetical protein ACI8X5_000764 [Planctomycetota bacterium]